MRDHIADTPSAGLADQATAAIRRLNHRTRAGEGLADPADLAKVIAALATMANLLPQLLGQLVHWVEQAQEGDRLRVDALSPLTDPNQMADVLTRCLRRGIEAQEHVALDLAAAHRYAARLAPAEPDTR